MGFAPCQALFGALWRQRAEGTLGESVVRVIDGDTLVIHHNGKNTSVRLPRVNALERNQPDGSGGSSIDRRLS